jgi:hypothetical protein
MLALVTGYIHHLQAADVSQLQTVRFETKVRDK